MDGGRWQRVKDLFAAALEKDAAERDAFLDEACAAEPELRAEVDSLLAAHDEHRRLHRAPRRPSRARSRARNAPALLDRPTRRRLSHRGGSRPRRHERGLQGRSRRRRVPEGSRDQGAAAGLRHEVPAEALQGRNADPRVARSPEHRAPARCRQHRGRPALSRDGAHPGAADRRATAREHKLGLRARLDLFRTALQRRAVRASAPDGSRRPEVQQRARLGERHGEAARLRHRAAAESARSGDGSRSSRASWR